MKTVMTKQPFQYVKLARWDQVASLKQFEASAYNIKLEIELHDEINVTLWFRKVK